jgi:hypothetical protein
MNSAQSVILGGISSLGAGEFSGLTIGGGTKIKKHIRVAPSVAMPVIPANSTVDIMITVSGAELGDSVNITPFGTPESGLMWSCRSAGTDLVSVRFANITSSSITPAAPRQFIIDVNKH